MTSAGARPSFAPAMITLTSLLAGIRLISPAAMAVNRKQADRSFMDQPMVETPTMEATKVTRNTTREMLCRLFRGSFKVSL